MMKTVFINAPENVEIKNFLYGNFYRAAKDDPEIKLVVFVNPNKVSECRRIFGHERCIIESAVDLKIEKQFFKKIFRIVSLSSIPTQSLWIRQKATYLNGGSFLSLIVKRCFWFLGHTKVWRVLLRKIEYYFFWDDLVWKTYFDKYRPDAVFAPSLMIQDDTAFLKYAKRRGVPSVGMVRSWDNFTTKLLLRVFPDLLLVQNSTMREEASSLDDFPEEKIRVVGFAQFDNYRNPDWFVNKDEVGARIGVDPAKRWIIYFTGGLPTVVFDKEATYTAHIKILKQAQDAGEFGNAVIFVRAHPTDPLGVEALSGVPILNFGKNFAYNIDDMKLLMNIMRFADVTVNLGSTMSLEAAIYNKPIVLAGFNGTDAEEDIPWQRRISVALDHTTHYKYVQETGGVWRVSNEKELIHAVKTYLENPKLYEDGRTKIVDKLVGPIDGGAGRRVLEMLKSVL